MKVDICSIVYNEEVLLPLWIESWRSVPFIRDIYLVDGGSTDKTVEIAKSYDRVNVMVVPWKNDFARQRNIALKLAKAEWVFQPDIDEIPCGKFNKLGELFENLSSGETYNQLIIPYLKFYNWDKLWFFSNNTITPTLFDNHVYYAVNKSTTTIFKKDHLRCFEKPLHEMPLYATSPKSSIFSLKGKSRLRLEELQDDFFIGHYDQTKHFEQAKRNNTSVEYEMGLKRARYRLINPAVYEGKTFDKQWAERAFRENNKEMFEDLGRMQLRSFLNQHTILEDYNAFGLNNEIVRKTISKNA
jgi:glycosyltransferase involved in cell wall biosynthesis